MPHTVADAQKILPFGELQQIVPSQPLSDQVYEILRSATRRGLLTPGQKVTERQLADQLEVSPTPVREALRQLVHERLFERSGPKTLRVALYQDETRREIADAEAALCGLAARFAARKANPSLIANLEALLGESDTIVERLDSGKSSHAPEEDVAQVLSLMRQFHHTIEIASGNAVVIGLIEQSRAFTDEQRHDKTLSTMSRTAISLRRRYRQHHDILAALKAGDEDRCEDITVRHHLDALTDLTAD